MSELVQRIVTRLQAEVPEYADIPPAQLADQSEAQLRSVLGVLSGDPSDSADGPTAYGKMRAEQGVPLDVVLHAYRVAWAELWSGILEVARISDIATPDELLSASTEFFWMADDFAGRMVMSYRSRSIELLLRRENERSATLEGVFSGYLNGAEKLWEAAAVLELPYEGHFVEGGIIAGRCRVCVAARTRRGGRHHFAAHSGFVVGRPRGAAGGTGPDRCEHTIQFADRHSARLALGKVDPGGAASVCSGCWAVRR
jgi:hypothetical protein